MKKNIFEKKSEFKCDRILKAEKHRQLFLRRHNKVLCIYIVTIFC